MDISIFKHKLIKNTFIYTASNAISRAIPFILLPILTRYLSTSDYGIVSTFEVILAIGTVIVGINLHGAVWVNFFKLKKENLKVYIGNIIYIEIISFILTIGMFFIFKSHISHLTKVPEGWLPVAALVALCRSISMVNLSLWQVEQKALPYGLFQILRTAFNVGFSLLFVILLGMKWEGRVLGIIISAIIFCLLSVMIIIKRGYIKLSFNKQFIKDALFFGLPLIPHSLSGWIKTGIDRIFINYMVSVSATGIYVVGYQVGMIIGLVATAFNQTWSPFLFEKLKEDKTTTKIKIVKFTYLYFIGIIILALILSAVAPPLLSFFVGKSFQSAYKYVVWIALGYAAHGMYFMVVNYIFYVKKTFILAWITFFSAIVHVILNYFLIKANGPIGAAQATTISFFVSFGLTWILSAKVYKMPWNLWKK